jgi:hypothetical protein
MIPAFDNVSVRYGWRADLRGPRDHACNAMVLSTDLDRRKLLQ